MFENVYNETITEFKREYGEKKYNQIYDKVVNSSSFKKNFLIFMGGNLLPSPAELVAVIQNIPFFTFSSKKYTAIGGAIFLNKWNSFCNTKNEVCEDEILVSILESLFEKSSGLLW